MASSTPFSAEQKYSPESFLRAVNLKVFPEARIFPSFVQVILGVGFPLAAQWNITSSPSMTVWSDGSVVKPDETKMVKRNTLSKNLNADNTAIFRLNVQYCSGIPQHYTRGIPTHCAREARTLHITSEATCLSKMHACKCKMQVNYTK